MKEIKHMSCDRIDSCPVPKFYRTLGKKWSFPILCRLRDDEDYRFEDLIHISRKNIHRTSLSRLLKELRELGILEKNERHYRLTGKGKQIKKGLIKIGEELLKPGSCPEMNTN